MTDIDIKNKLLSSYSRNFGNNERGLAEAAEEYGILKVSDFKDEFDALQLEIYNFLYDYTASENIQLTGPQLESMTRTYCKGRFNWINADALKSILDYIAWICWHEGILK